MRLRSRLSTIVVLTAGAVLLLGAAVLVGRTMPATVVAVDLADDPGIDVERFGLLHVERAHLIRGAVSLPDKREADFYGATIRTLQRVERFEFVEWTFSDIDVRTGALTPLLHVKTSRDERLRPYDLTPAGGAGRWRVYLENSGQLWETDGRALQSRLVGSLDPFLTRLDWIDGGRRVVATGLSGLVAMNADGSERIVADLPDMAFGWTVLSDDGARLVTMAVGVGVANRPLIVYDTGDLSLVAQFSGSIPSWCGRRLIYFAVDGRGGSSTHLVDVDTGADEVVPLRDVPAALGNYYINPVGRDCEWLESQLLPTGEKWLLHRRSGAFIELGLNAEVVAIDGETVTYRAQTDGMTELRRTRPDGVDELLGRYPALPGDIVYISDWRGLKAEKRILWLVDLAAGTQTPLIDAGVRDFVVLP